MCKGPIIQPPSRNMTDKELMFPICRSEMKSGSEEHLSLAMMPQMFELQVQGRTVSTTSEQPQPHLIFCGYILWEDSSLTVTVSSIEDLNPPEINQPSIHCT